MDLGVLSFINLASLGGMLYFGGNIVKEWTDLSSFQSAKVYSPNRLLQYFQRKDFKKQAKINEDNPEEYVVRGFVEGYVDCKNPFKSVIDRKTKLIYSLYYKNEIYSNDSLGKPTRF